MSREILLDSLCGQTRLAVMEDGVLCEMYAEREDAHSLSGNIYVGRVQNVLTGMNAAFVDIGLDKNGFLYAGDIHLDTRSHPELAGSLQKMDIRRMASPGQEILVQVVKEPGGSKGPRLTCHITLPGRGAVLLPTMKYVGISRRIQSEEKRRSLRETAGKLAEEYGAGLIVRTAGGEMSETELREEVLSLLSRYRDIEKRGRALKAPVLLWQAASLPQRAIQDMLGADTLCVRTDDEALYALLKQTAEQATPRYADRVTLDHGHVPLFDARGIDAAYEKALRRQVWLKSGGYLVVDFTEALTVIDVNTGKFVGNGDAEKTIWKTNCEAAVEIARQLRLRDIGGIIIVDFIDMKSPADADRLTELLRAELNRDSTRTVVEGMTSLGLMQITRKKARLSAQKLLRSTCPRCGGTGWVEDEENAAWRVLRSLRRRVRDNPGQAWEIHCSEKMADVLTAIGAPENVRAYLVTDRQRDLFDIEPVNGAEGKDERMLPTFR